MKSSENRFDSIVCPVTSSNSGNEHKRFRKISLPIRSSSATSSAEKFSWQPLGGSSRAIDLSFNGHKSFYVYAAPGYSFPYIGGAATHIVIPSIVMELGCLPTTGMHIFGSQGEPVSVLSADLTSITTRPGSYEHLMGIVEGGKMALLAESADGSRPLTTPCMPALPGLLVVTDIDASPSPGQNDLYCGRGRTLRVLVYVNTADIKDVPAHLRASPAAKIR